MAIAHLDDAVMQHARLDYVRVDSGLTVAEALVQARGSAAGARFLYFYVVDPEGRLEGVLPTRNLLLSEPDRPIAEIMQNRVVSIPESATLADACEFFLLHRFLAFPIVNAEKHILGVIDVEVYADEMAGLAMHESAHEAHQESEDFFQLIGVRLEEVRRATPAVAFKARFPWLLCNVIGGLAAAVVAGWFEGVLDHVIELALFIPVVLAIAESVSIQSLSLTLQTHHRWTKIGFHGALKALRQELPVGLLLGIGCAVAVAGVVWLWRGDAAFAMCLLLTIATTVILATLFGILTPALLHATRLDPRIAAGPIVLTLTDLTTLVVYLGIAAWMLG